VKLDIGQQFGYIYKTVYIPFQFSIFSLKLEAFFIWQ